jgi:lipid A 3-O-deacylase
MRAALFFVIMALFIPQVRAADPARPVNQPRFISEIRLGGSLHDPWSPEKNSFNLTTEALFQQFWTAHDPALQPLIPRLHVGGSLNTNGETSFAYGGFTWTFDISPRFFVEGSLGGALHNGETGAIVPANRNNLGCSPLFREAFALGYKIDAQWTITASIQHLSNAGLCDGNRGLTNLGAQIGYRF